MNSSKTTKAVTFKVTAFKGLFRETLFFNNEPLDCMSEIRCY